MKPSSFYPKKIYVEVERNLEYNLTPEWISIYSDYFVVLASPFSSSKAGVILIKARLLPPSLIIYEILRFLVYT